MVESILYQDTKRNKVQISRDVRYGIFQIKNGTDNSFNHNDSNVSMGNIRYNIQEMKKLIWELYNTNQISMEVAQQLLDCHYNRQPSYGR